MLPQCLPDIGRDVQIGVAVPTIAKPPVPGADAADGHVAAVCMVIEIAPDMGVDRGGIARVDAVEAGVVVGRLAGIVIVAAGIAGVETADGEAPVPQKLLVERSEEHTSELQSLMRISYAVFCL